MLSCAAAAAGAAGFALLAAAGIYRGNNRLTVSEYEIPTDKLTRPVRVVQLSDLHNKRFGPENRRLIRAVEALGPDFVVCTGDLEDRRQPYNPATARFLGELAKRSPVFFVYGNQEMRGGFREKLARDLTARGVQVLENAKEQIMVDGQALTVIGLENYIRRSRRYTREVNCPELFRGAAGFVLLLSHYPQYFDRMEPGCAYSDLPADLILTGHAHGGLIRLFGRGLIAPGQGLFPDRTAGRFEKNGVTMIISRGLGNSGLPFRINNPPEIVAVTLAPSGEGKRS